MVYARICIFLQITFLRKYFISGLASEKKNNFGLKTHSSVSDILMTLVCRWHSSSFILLKH